MSSFLIIAQSDLQVAALIMNTLNDELALCKAAYHVQQSVEQTLKGIPEVIQERAFKITRWAVEARYNINYRVSFKELEMVYNACNEWLEEILKNINT